MGTRAILIAPGFNRRRMRKTARTVVWEGRRAQSGQLHPIRARYLTTTMGMPNYLHPPPLTRVPSVTFWQSLLSALEAF